MRGCLQAASYWITQKLYQDSNALQACLQVPRGSVLTGVHLTHCAHLMNFDAHGMHWSGNPTALLACPLSLPPNSVSTSTSFKFELLAAETKPDSSNGRLPIAIRLLYLIIPRDQIFSNKFKSLDCNSSLSAFVSHVYRGATKLCSDALFS